jgi:hypothetical protein
MEFVCKREMGILERNINHIPDVLNRVLTDIEYSNTIRNNIKRASISNGVNKVSEYILKFNS